MNSPRDPLSTVLGEWQVKPARDPQYRTRVWARIEAAQREKSRGGSWMGFARGHAALVAGAFALAIVLGAVSGRSQARARLAEESARIASVYVQSLDARAMQLR
jgi:hypothetical protein